MIGMAVFYVVVGFFAGFAIGMCMKAFKKCKKWPQNVLMYAKFAVMLIMSITIPIICYWIGFKESKYILIIFYGYFCYQVWGEHGRP